MEKFFTNDFWETFAHKLSNWAITELPSLIILVVLLLVSLRVSSFLIRKLKNWLAKRSSHETDDPNPEVEKRLNTLMGILRRVRL